MDGLILRRMVMFLRYGGADGEDEDAGIDRGKMYRFRLSSIYPNANKCDEKTYRRKHFLASMISCHVVPC